MAFRCKMPYKARNDAFQAIWEAFLAFCCYAKSQLIVDLCLAYCTPPSQSAEKPLREVKVENTTSY